ncbi:heat shock 70 kDa protein 14-B-like [Acipenser ruthenus]|uniref:heat shock 70 kDa protein 14-B-like n=1 Tax=Acipenser ruthenus TaxID=7906 RepID=UPI00145AA18D|nr:heat shock 70 kDa protein 14-B-like [Acipenser ruthenus]
MAAIGVHFGCTCACVAVFKDGRADVIANDSGDRVTPAVVAYREREQIVGLAAKQGRIRNASNTVVKVKQILGRSYDDPQAQKHITESKCSVIDKDQKPRYEIDTGEDTKLVPPEEVAKLIFSKMKETAQSALGSDVTDAVITVPFEFGEKQKNALRQAAMAAGFNVLRLIHEPSAALLAYGIGQESPTGKSYVLVYKLGGTSLSVTVMEVNSGMYRVLATQTDDSIGGECFTEALAQHLASEFQRTYKQDVRGNPRAMMKLMNSADAAKHTLSTLGSSNCFVDSLHDGMDFDCNVSRARFELVCSLLFNKSIQPIKNLLDQVGLSANDINRVVLCGGSARIPKLQQMIRDLFPDVELLNSIPTDEVIPIGAAIEAGILVGKDSSLLDEESFAVECCAKDILVKEADDSGADVYTVLLPSGTPLPARRHHTLQSPGNVSSVCFELYQSIGKNCASQANKFAQIVLEDLEKIEETTRDIITVLTMKRDGSLHVTCTDQGTGKSEAITIEVAS